MNGFGGKQRAASEGCKSVPKTMATNKKKIVLIWHEICKSCQLFNGNRVIDVQPEKCL
jgi:hypothetical protein